MQYSDDNDSLNYSSCQLAGILGAGFDITVQKLSSYRGPDSVFSALLKQVDTPIGELPTEQRRNLAIGLVGNAWSNSPDLFLMALNCNRITQDAIAEEGMAGGRWTLLHAAAGAIGQLVRRVAFSGREFEKFRTMILGWKSIIQDLLDAGADLHAACSRDCPHFFRFAEMDGRTTPLMSMLAGLFSTAHRWYRPRSYAGEAMNFWISILYDCGVDLEEYGLRESLTWVNLEEPAYAEEEYTGVYTRETRDYDSDYYFGKRRLLGFRSGPSSEDWGVWENEPTDEFAGEFWLMVDRRVEAMPGSWTG